MELLDKKETAAILRISTVSVDRLRKRGALGSRKVGRAVRFLAKDIESFIEASKEVSK